MEYLLGLLPYSSIKAVYDPKAFIPHAASLDQTCVHCPMFLTAATRRCRTRISVSTLGITLSRPLPVIALVGRYLTNKLIGRRFLPYRPALLRGFTLTRPSGISPPFGELCLCKGWIPTCY